MQCKKINQVTYIKISCDLPLWSQNLYFLSLYKHRASDMISFWQIMKEANQKQVGINKDGEKYRTQQKMPFSSSCDFCTFSHC